MVTPLNITNTTRYRKAFFSAHNSNNKAMIQKLNRKPSETKLSYNIRIDNLLRSKTKRKQMQS
jgi:hypothetical protein